MKTSDISLCQELFYDIAKREKKTIIYQNIGLKVFDSTQVINSSWAVIFIAGTRVASRKIQS